MKIKFTLILALGLLCHIVSIAQTLTVNISGAGILCSGNSIYLSAECSDTTAGLSWSGPNGFTANGSSILINNASANQSGYYFVTATDYLSNTVTNSMSVTVYQTPDVYPISNQIICNGYSTAAINFNGITAANYSWTNDNTATGLDPSGSGNIVSFQATNVGNVPSVSNITVTPSANGCIGSSQSFSIEVDPTIANPTISISTNSGVNICPGTSVIFTAIGNNGGSAPIYQWVKNGNNVGNSDITYTDNSLGNQDVVSCILTSNANCIATTTAYSNNDTFAIYIMPAIGSQPVNQTVCSGDSTTFTVSGTGSGINYQWQVNAGSGFTSISDGGGYSGTTTSVIVVSGTVAGMDGYQYRCVISGNCTPSVTSDAATLNVQTPPSIISQPIGSTICDGNNVSFGISASGTSLSYQWQVNTGSGFVNVYNNGMYYGATANTLNIIGAASYMNNYQYRCILAGVCAAASVTNVAQLNFNPSPIAIIVAAGPVTFCQGGNVIINANNGAYSYQWQLNGSNILGAVGSSVTAIDGGDYTVTITNVFGCVSTSSPVSVNAIQVPAAPVNVLMGSLAFCAGTSVVLETNTGSGLSYQWQNNGVNIAGGTGVIYTANTAGNYSVIVSNSNCTNTSAAVNVSVNPMPSNNLTLNGSPIICPGSSVLISAVAVAGQSYQWFENGLTIAGANAYQFQAMDGGIYSVKITSQEGCILFSQAVTTQLSVTPTPVISQQGGSLTTGSFAGYQWYLNGNAIAGANNAAYLPTQNGTYTVMATNNDGCSGISVPYLIANLSILPLDASKELIQMYPNPVSSILHIEARQAVKISIYNMQGKMVLTQDNAKNADMSLIPDGIYMVHAYNADNELIATERLIKVGR